MSLVTEITNIVTTLYPDATFKLLSEFNEDVESYFVNFLENFNDQAASDEFPFIVLDNYIPTDFEIMENANFNDTVMIKIKAWDIDNFDTTDSASQVIVESMTEILKRIAANIYRLTDVFAISARQKGKIIPRIKQLNPILTGAELQMNVIYRNIINFCPTP